jgi:hypothetical protein
MRLPPPLQQFARSDVFGPSLRFDKALPLLSLTSNDWNVQYPVKSSSALTEHFYTAEELDCGV